MLSLLLTFLLLAPPPGQTKPPAALKADKPAPQGLPISESLRFSVNWPSGLSFGEGHLRTLRGESGAWDLEFTIEANVPGFPILDQYRSRTDGDFCSLVLEKTFRHGQKQGGEKTTFDREKGTITRETLDGGGKSERDVGRCGRDALAFVQFVRRELAQGRIPPQQDVIFGATYNVKLDYKGTAVVALNGGSPQQADWMIVTLKGPQTDLTFDLFFAKDAARTPLQVRVPLQLGVVTADLQR